MSWKVKTHNLNNNVQQICYKNYNLSFKSLIKVGLNPTFYSSSPFVEENFFQKYCTKIIIWTAINHLSWNNTIKNRVNCKRTCSLSVLNNRFDDYKSALWNPNHPEYILSFYKNPLNLIYYTIRLTLVGNNIN